MKNIKNIINDTISKFNMGGSKWDDDFEPGSIERTAQFLYWRHGMSITMDRKTKYEDIFQAWEKLLPSKRLYWRNEARSLINFVESFDGK